MTWRAEIIVREKCKECHRYATVMLHRVRATPDDPPDQYPQGPFCALHGRQWLARLN